MRAGAPNTLRLILLIYWVYYTYRNKINDRGAELGAGLTSLKLVTGKRYVTVAEKEYINMISSYITADWSNIE